MSKKNNFGECMNYVHHDDQINQEKNSSWFIGTLMIIGLILMALSLNQITMLIGLCIFVFAFLLIPFPIKINRRKK